MFRYYNKYSIIISKLHLSKNTVYWKRWSRSLFPLFVKIIVEIFIIIRCLKWVYKHSLNAVKDVCWRVKCKTLTLNCLINEKVTIKTPKERQLTFSWCLSCYLRTYFERQDKCFYSFFGHVFTKCVFRKWSSEGFLYKTCS